jgi:hypothetical protein
VELYDLMAWVAYINVEDELKTDLIGLSAPPSTSIHLYRLHYEILQFYQFMIPTAPEHAIRQQVIDRICAVIHQYLPSASVREGQKSMRSFSVIVFSPDRYLWKSQDWIEFTDEVRE